MGDDRVVYAIDDDARVVDIRVVRHRSDAYRSMAQPQSCLA